MCMALLKTLAVSDAINGFVWVDAKLTTDTPYLLATKKVTINAQSTKSVVAFCSSGPIA